MEFLLHCYQDYEWVESLPTIMPDGSIEPPNGIWFQRTIKVRRPDGSVHLEKVVIPIEQLMEERNGV